METENFKSKEEREREREREKRKLEKVKEMLNRLGAESGPATWLTVVQVCSSPGRRDDD